MNPGYDTYDSAVVAAYSEDEARNMRPDGRPTEAYKERYDSWCEPDDVQVNLIGEAAEDIAPGAVICASFNAG